jgi:hypothetical protein
MLWEKENGGNGGQFNISDNINLSAGKEVRINGQLVLSSTSLGASITSAPGITSFGPQTQLTVDNILVDGNTISTTNLSGDLILSPQGTGVDPVGAQDAATKNSVETFVKGRTLAVTIDCSDFTVGNIDTKVAIILTAMYPPASYQIGTEAEVLCTSTQAQFTAIDVASQISRTYKAVLSIDGSTQENVLEDFSIGSVPTGSATITVTRLFKRFQIQGTPGSGVWTKTIERGAGYTTGLGL